MRNRLTSILVFASTAECILFVFAHSHFFFVAIALCCVCSWGGRDVIMKLPKLHLVSTGIYLSLVVSFFFFFSFLLFRIPYKFVCVFGQTWAGPNTHSRFGIRWANRRMNTKEKKSIRRHFRSISDVATHKNEAAAGICFVDRPFFCFARSRCARFRITIRRMGIECGAAWCTLNIFLSFVAWHLPIPRSENLAGFVKGRHLLRPATKCPQTTENAQRNDIKRPFFFYSLWLTEIENDIVQGIFPCLHSAELFIE